MNVIFLDVDGVLNCSRTKETAGDWTGIGDCHVMILRKITTLMDAQIILTSSWKEGWHKAQKEKQDILANTLDKALKKHGLMIEDKTEDLRFNRGIGILRWIERYRPEYYIILDDAPFDYQECGIEDHWVETSYWDGGLTEEHFRHIKTNLEKYRNRKE